MSTDKLKKTLIRTIPYLVLGLLFSNLGEAWRISSGAELGEKLLSFFSSTGIAFRNPAPSFHPFDLLIGTLFGALLRLTVYLRGKNAKHFKHNQEYGSARWLTSQGVVDPHIRDQFSAGGQEEMLLSTGERVKFPGVYRRIKAYSDMFIRRMRQEDPTILVERAVLQPDQLNKRLLAWADAVSRRSTVRYDLSMDALKTYFFRLGNGEGDHLWNRIK